MILEIDIGREQHRNDLMQNSGWDVSSTGSIRTVPSGFSQSTAIVIPVELTIDVGSAAGVFAALQQSVLGAEPGG